MPREWTAFAKEYGVSRGDLDRLRLIEHRDGEYKPAAGVPHDMRLLELVLLLNEP